MEANYTDKEPWLSVFHASILSAALYFVHLVTFHTSVGKRDAGTEV